jgi:hypothetical protein
MTLQALRLRRPPGGCRASGEMMLSVWSPQRSRLRGWGAPSSLLLPWHWWGRFYGGLMVHRHPAGRRGSFEPLYLRYKRVQSIG